MCNVKGLYNLSISLLLIIIKKILFLITAGLTIQENLDQLIALLNDVDDSSEFMKMLLECFYLS